MKSTYSLHKALARRLKTLISLVMFSALLAFTQVKAEEIFACGLKCTSLYSQAQKISNSLNDREVFSVLDTKTAEVESFQVVKFADSQGKLTNSIVEINKTPEAIAEQSFFISYIQNLNELVVHVPENDTATGFSDLYSSTDLIIYPQNQDWVALNLEANATLHQEIKSRFVALTNRINIGFNFAMEHPLTAQFYDGSTADFMTLTSLSTGGNIFIEVVYVDGSARLADGSEVQDSQTSLVLN